ncbi:MAG: hypothetical protein GY874_21985 [Desulfobacteraceae bacterium]|nr:hypothetical protein [Desulfobacteraceae bacterium]
MPKEIWHDEKNQLLRIQFTSESTVDDWKRALEQVERMSEQMGIFRVLVDVREQTDLATTSDLYSFACRLPRSIAFAVLCKIHLNKHTLIEYVAGSKGAIVKDFIFEQDAIEWLKKVFKER